MQDSFTSDLNQLEALDGVVVQAPVTSPPTTTMQLNELPDTDIILGDETTNGVIIIITVVVGVLVGAVVIGVAIAVLVWWLLRHFRKSNVFIRRISGQNNVKTQRTRAIRVVPETLAP